jgi:hypothetical protein
MAMSFNVPQLEECSNSKDDPPLICTVARRIGRTNAMLFAGQGTNGIRRLTRSRAGGWGGIRTLGTFRYTRFPGVPDRPLWHPS